VDLYAIHTPDNQQSPLVELAMDGLKRMLLISSSASRLTGSEGGFGSVTEYDRCKQECEVVLVDLSVTCGDVRFLARLVADILRIHSL